MARRFEFSGGTSNKFWTIELSGNSFTVTFGRIGTAGQTQVKKFASVEAARTACEKLIAEKTGKGYREVGAKQTAPGTKSSAVKSAVAAPKSQKAPSSAAAVVQSVSGNTASASVSAKRAGTTAARPGTPAVTAAAEISLDAEDAFFVTYKPHKRLIRPEPAPFDVEQAVKQVKRIKWKALNVRNWSSICLPKSITREEAHFWFAALQQANVPERDRGYSGLLKKKYDGKVSVDDARRLVRQNYFIDTAAPMLLPLATLFSFDEFVDIVLDQGKGSRTGQGSDSYARRGLVGGFHRYVLPYLTESEKDCFRKAIARFFDVRKWGAGWGVQLQSFYYAAALGMHSETLSLVKIWKDGTWANENDCWAHIILFGLGSRELVVSHSKRTGLSVDGVEPLRGWLAHTGADELQLVADGLAGVNNKQDAAEMVRYLGEHVRAPQTATAMLQIFHSSKAPDLAREWLEANRDLAAPALEAAAAGSGHIAEEARRFLQSGKPKASAPATAVSVSPVSEAPAAKPAPRIDEIRLPKGVERSVELAPADFFWVTYREHKPLSPDKRPKPFNVQEKVDWLNAKDWVNWEDHKFDLNMGREEALFWLLAMHVYFTPYYKQKGNRYAHLAKTDLKKQPPLKDLKRLLGEYYAGPDMILMFRLVYGAEAIAKVLLLESEKDLSEHKLITGFHLHVLPYLSKTEYASVRRLVDATKPAHPWPLDFRKGYPEPYYFFCSSFGLHDKTLKLVESWKDGFYARPKPKNMYWHHYPEEIILGLDSADLVQHHMRRTGARMLQPDQVRGYLAHTGWSGLDVVETSIRSLRARGDVEPLVAALALVKAPEAAQVMLRLLRHGPATEQAREYLLADPVHSAAGLIPLAASKDKDAQEARGFLGVLKSNGHSKAILSAAAAYGREAEAFVRAEVLTDLATEFACAPAGVLPDKARQLLATLSAGPIPSWAKVSELTPLRLGKTTLAGSDLESFVRGLRASTLDTPHAIVGLLKEIADPAERDAFAWKLAELWLRDGGPSKDKWALAATGLIGGDMCALKLAPLIRAWPGESQHQRAVFGLDCLRAIGSDVALMQISGIAGKLKFAALKKRANECMEAIAAERRMSRAQLEDRIIPDCDLNEQGTRVFDYGPRQFRMVLGPGLKPMLRCPDNSLKPSLPAPTSKDDAKLAKAAGEDWKVTKKVVQDAAKIQANRLEQAMVTGRRWTVQEFETLLVRHPLMRNLVNGLIWAAYDEKGKLRSSFRITEDCTYADSKDNEVRVVSAAHIGLPHPLHLSDKEKAEWGQLFGDYQIIAPFTQIGREMFSLNASESKKNRIDRYAGLEIPAASVVYTLDKFGWQREVTSDAGFFNQHTKQFYGAGMTACVEYEPGSYVQAVVDSDDQTITGCRFFAGLLTPSRIPGDAEALKLDRIDPVVISEVLRELNLIAEKGTPK